MNDAHLRALVEVMQTGSVGAAAYNLHLSSPAVSKQIKTLERELDVRLFDKVGRNLVPRQEAHAVYRCASDLFRRIEELRDELAAEDGQVRGTVTIGCGSFFARTVLPPIITRCLREHPHLRVSLSEYARGEELRERLYRGDFRLMLVLDWLGDPELMFDPLFEDELVLIVPHDHPLARKPHKPLPPEALRGQPIITHSYARVLSTVFERTGVPAEVLLQDEQLNLMMRTTESVFAFVTEGAGIAFVPRYLVRLAPHHKVVERRLTTRLPLTFGIYRLSTTVLTAAEQLVVDKLREGCRDIGLDGRALSEPASSPPSSSIG